MHLLKTFLVLLFLFVHVKAQDAPAKHVLDPLHPNLAIVIGILSVMFSVLFLLLAYAMFCHSALSNRTNDQEQDPEGVLRSTSGIERSIIDTLPFFTFSSLKGSKEGLECAVCLSEFEDTEVLRLLPSCRHAFHMNCIDKWLESHSSCPICRHKFDAGDFRTLSFTNSLRYTQNLSNLSENPNLDLFIQREQERHRSSRFNMASSLQKLGIGRKEELLIPRCSKNGNLDEDPLHKFKHKIIVSDLIYKSRWSDVNSSDLMFLNSEMLNIKSSKRFSPIKSNSHRFPDHFQMKDEILKIKEDIERKRSYESKVKKIAGSSVSTSSSPGDSNIGLNQIVTSKLLDSADKRSMSEIINISRYADISVRNRTNEPLMLSRSGRIDDRIRRLWLPIATRTVQWFAGRERGLDWKRSPLNV